MATVLDDVAWTMGEWEVRRLCRDCEGSQFAKNPKDPMATARGCPSCRGSGLEVTRFAALTELEAYTVRMKREAKG
jgi:DnaJ-class molecular chaperone